ncbi:hypothetical protein N0V83_007875 [Neocucurbitaria cava]|uniref:Uncharacterized protein n=1 Tax=Neocucurbitaria cava TaxID=798079 RepID=A0A9W9CJ13_9PLEO|nr:hypothetical protein N0V83_007875 [Neocucurbitaria cava]
MYTSTDLLNWTPASNPKNSIQYMWRPKLAKPDGSWRIYGQVDRKVQALKSSSIADGYSVSGSSVALPPSSYTYSDTGMFRDDDGTWYILTSADHNNVQVNKINSDGSVGSRVNYLAKGSYEAPGMFKVNGIYYLIVSGKTGWRSNPNKVFWASSLTGSWNGGDDIAPSGENTYNSQNTFEFTLKGSKKTTYIYMGDSWDSKGGPSSNYIWLPMNVDTSNKKVTLEYHAQWRIDVSTGEVTTPSKKRRYEAEDAELKGSVLVRDCSHCLNKRGVHDFSQDGGITFRNVTGLGGKQWVQLHYHVADRSAGEAQISVNDGPFFNVSELNSRAGYHYVIPVELELEAGPVNSIEIRATNEAGGIVIDGIEAIED